MVEISENYLSHSSSLLKQLKAPLDPAPAWKDQLLFFIFIEAANDYAV